MKENQGVKLSVWVKTGYGVGEFSHGLTWALYFVFFLYFLTDIVKMDPATAGLVMMLGILWDGVSDPLIGILTDKLKTKWGRRRPLLLAAAVPYGVATWLLFTDFGFGPVARFIYFCLMLFVFYTLFTIVNVCMTALIAEMTPDYNERSSLAAHRALWAQVSNIIGFGVPLMLTAQLTNALGDPAKSWSIMAAIFGASCVIPIVVTWRSTRGREIFPETTQVSLKDIYQSVLKNRPFVYTWVMWVCSDTASAILSAIAVYYLTYHVQLSETETSMALGYVSLVSIFWLPVINWISKKWGKAQSYILFMAVWIVSSFIFTFMIEPRDLQSLYTVLFFIAGGNVASYAIGWSMIADVIEVDEFKTGNRREGMYFGIMSFGQKAAAAIAVWAVGIVLSMVGYVPKVAQSAETIWGIKMMNFCGVLFFLIIGIGAALLMPMTRENHAALRKAISQKSQGQAYDSLVINDLVR